MINGCIIGLGNRGYTLLRDVLIKIENLNFVAVCDLYEDRVQQALELITAAGQKAKECQEDMDTSKETSRERFRGWRNITEAISSLPMRLRWKPKLKWRKR